MALILSRDSGVPFFSFRFPFWAIFLIPFFSLSVYVSTSVSMRAQVFLKPQSFRSRRNMVAFQVSFSSVITTKISQQGLLFQLGAGSFKFLILASSTNTKPQLKVPHPLSEWKPEAKREGRKTKANQMPAAKFCCLLHSRKHTEATWHNFSKVFSGLQVGDTTHSAPHCQKKGGEAESHRTVAPRKVNYLTLFWKQWKHSSELWWPFLQCNTEFFNSAETDMWLNT